MATTTKPKKAKLPTFQIVLVNPDGQKEGVKTMKLTWQAVDRKTAEEQAVAWARKEFNPRYHLKGHPAPEVKV